MAKPQAKVTFLSPINSPAMSSQEPEGYDHVDDYEQETYSADGFCSCFRLFKWHRINDNEDQNVLNQNGEPREPSWLVKKLKKLKEVSEVIAGPRWKTFIRKISAHINKKKKNQRYNKNQYDPESYALNFDSTGVDDDLLPVFSSRFVGSSVDEIRQTGL